MLKMKQGVHWVDLPEDMLPKIPESGIVEYRFTETEKDFQQGGRVRTIYKNEVTLPPTFKIRTADNKVLELGLVGGYDERGNPNSGEITQLSWKAQSLGGRLYLHPNHDELQLGLFQALELHPEVGGNSNTQSNLPKRIVKVDQVSEAKLRRENRGVERQAMSIALELNTTPKIERAALILGINFANRDSELVLDDIESMAKLNPADFIKRMEDKDGDLRAEIAKAFLSRSIVVEQNSNQIKFVGNNAVIMTVADPSPAGATNELVVFINTDPKGPTVLKTIQALNGTKEKLAAKAATTEDKEAAKATK